MRVIKVFADTNVMFYGRDDADDLKVITARHWVSYAAKMNALCLNLQVLNELTTVLLRKRKQLRPAQVFEAVDTLIPFGASPVNLETVESARGLHTTLGYSWWDCVLLASALELRCSHFLSEDLSDSQQIAGMTIINPFLHSPEAIFGARQD